MYNQEQSYIYSLHLQYFVEIWKCNPQDTFDYFQFEASIFEMRNPSSIRALLEMFLLPYDAESLSNRRLWVRFKKFHRLVRLFPTK